MNRIKNQSTILNIILTLITKFIVLLGTFVISVILARILGPEGKGVVTSILVVPTLLISLAELGLRQSAAYYVGRKLYSVTDIVSNLTFLWIVTSVTSVIMVLVIFASNYNEYEWSLLLLAALTIPFNLVINYSKGVLQGMQRYTSINGFELYKILINFILIIMLVWLLKMDVLGAILVQLLMALIIAIYSIRIILEITAIKIKIDMSLTKDLFLKGITFGLALFILQLNYRVDIIFLEYYRTSEDVGLYSVGTNLAELIWQVPAAASIIIFGKSANSKLREEAINRTSKLLRIILPFLLVFCFFFALLSSFLVNVIYGSDFANSSMIIKLLLPGVLAMVIVKILHADLAGRGFPLYAISVTLVPLILNCVLNYLFIPTYGIEGAALTSSFSYVLSGVLFVIVYIKKERIPVKDLIIIKKEDLVMIKNLINKKLR